MTEVSRVRYGVTIEEVQDNGSVAKSFNLSRLINVIFFCLMICSQQMKVETMYASAAGNATVEVIKIRVFVSLVCGGVESVRMRGVVV